MSITHLPQASLYEATIENAALEEALEEREACKARAGAARKAFREADDRAKALAAELELGEEPVRVGRFMLARRQVAARVVSFETDPSSRLTIAMIEDAA